MSRVSPTGLSAQYSRGGMEDKLREICNQLNGISEGRAAAKYNALASVPTTGSYQQGDFVANSAPVEVGGQYVLLGWICTVSGTPGTFEEVRTLTTAVSGGGYTVTEVEIDFGSSPVYDATFTITDAAITSSSVKVVVSACGKAATGRTADDWQWDGGTFAANPGTGSATCYATFHPGPIVGKRMLQYSIG